MKHLILFLIILLPVMLALWLYQGEPQYETLDIHGPVQEVNGKKTYHTIPDFELTNQKNESFALSDLDDKMHVANFIFTRCPTECPVMTSNMKKVEDHFREKESIHFISFTIDPNHDTPEVLYEFAEKYNADHERWHFLTGDKDEIHSLARDGYFLTVKEGDERAQQYLHSEFFLLIDKENRIRGIYNGMNEAEIIKLKEEILVLANEQ